MQIIKMITEYFVGLQLISDKFLNIVNIKMLSDKTKYD
jgi:hypothetical protein